MSVSICGPVPRPGAHPPGPAPSAARWGISWEARVVDVAWSSLREGRQRSAGRLEIGRPVGPAARQCSGVSLTWCARVHSGRVPAVAGRTSERGSSVLGLAGQGPSELWTCPAVWEGRWAGPGWTGCEFPAIGEGLDDVSLDDGGWSWSMVFAVRSW